MIARKLFYLMRLTRRKYGKPLEELRDELFQELKEKTWSESPFYRRRWEAQGLDSESIKSAELADLPIVSHEDFRAEIEDVKNLGEVGKSYATTGTTGQRLEVPFDEESAEWREAVSIRTEIAHGVRPFQSFVEFWGHPQSLLGDLLRPKTIISQDADIDSQIEIIEEENPSYLVYGAHVLFRVAKRIRNRGGTDVKVKKIFCRGELLTSGMRELIEEVFDAETVDIYETSEVGQIAYECVEGGYHVNDDLVRVEVLDEDNEPVEEGETGRVIVTGLVSRLAPTIRYEIGDLVKAGSSCSCETVFSKIQGLRGRDYRYLRGRGLHPDQIIDEFASYHSIGKFVLERDEDGLVFRYTELDEVDEAEIRKSLESLDLEADIRKEDEIDREAWKCKPLRLD